MCHFCGGGSTVTRHLQNLLYSPPLSHAFTHIPGGLDDVNCYRTVERYDPQSDDWTEVCSLRSPRGGVGVAQLGKYLYAAGGNDGSASLQTVER